jgi:hypothetical protein
MDTVIELALGKFKKPGNRDNQSSGKSKQTAS